VGLQAVAPGQDFILDSGTLLPWAEGNQNLLRAIFVLLAAGMAVKAALVPLHGWLPQAMVAPAPVSALLHAVAVVKAGAFGLVRLVDDVFGHELVARLGVGLWLAAPPAPPSSTARCARWAPSTSSAAWPGRP
jgi:multicomponent Na+:H+ antiporter subunit D